MPCLHDTQENIENALSSAFENYGREVFFDEDGENEGNVEQIGEVIGALIHASVTLDEFLSDDSKQETTTNSEQHP